MPAAVLLDHVTVVTDDFHATRVLYDALAGALGWAATVEYSDPEEEDDDTQTVAALGYAEDGRPPSLWLVAGTPATKGAHMAFTVAERSLVESVHLEMAAAGATVLQAPREWEERQLSYYGTQIVDHDGNVIEVLHRG